MEHTEFGDYLKKKWKEEVKAEKHRRNQKKWWFPIWEGSQLVVLLILLAPIALVGFVLFSVFAQVFSAIAMVVVSIIILGIIIAAIIEHFSDGSINFDYEKLMGNEFVVIALLVISAIITIAIVMRLFL